MEARMDREFRSPVPCLLAALACALGTAPARAQSCVELGPRYAMYTYTAGNRVGVENLGSDTHYLIALACKYDAKGGVGGLDLGFGRRCVGADVAAGGKPCRITRIDTVKSLEIDPSGEVVVRRAPAK
jgi:hypothetical protein